MVLAALLSFDGSGVAQASLEPQGSTLEKFEKAFVLADVAVGFVGACEEGVGAERLKAEAVCGEGTACF